MDTMILPMAPIITWTWEPLTPVALGLIGALIFVALGSICSTIRQLLASKKDPEEADPGQETSSEEPVEKGADR